MELCSSDEDDYSYADFDLSPDEGQVSDDGDDAVQDQCTWWSPAFPVEYQSFFAMCRVRAPCPCARLVAAIQSGSMGRSMKHMRMLTQQTCTLSLVRAHAARAIMEIPGALGAMTELLAKALNPDLPPVRSASMHYTSFCTFLTLGNTLSPLVMAVRCGHAGVVTTLLEHGADPTQFISQESRWRPVDAVNVLNHALSRGHFDVARTLLQHGADPNNLLTDDRILMPPLIRHYLGGCAGSRTQHLQAVRLLLEHKADPNALDAQYFSALHYACRDICTLPLIQKSRFPPGHFLFMSTFRSQVCSSVQIP